MSVLPMTVELPQAVASDQAKEWDAQRWHAKAWSLAKPIIVLLLFTTATYAVGYLLSTINEPITYMVDKANCTCDCYDRVMKGRFFLPHKQYRYIYLNIEGMTWLIICWTAIYMHAFICSLGRAVRLWWEKRMHWPIFGALAVNIYGQIYNFSCTWHYFNDRIHHLLATQMFFNVTEWAITLPLYWLLARGSSIPSWISNLAMAVALCHVWAALEDQGFYHIVFNARGSLLSSVLRHLFLFLSDLVPLITLYWCIRPRGLIRHGSIMLIAEVFYGLYAAIRLIWGYSFN